VTLCNVSKWTFILLAWVAPLYAQSPKPPAPKPVPSVTVVKADESTVKGWLLAAGPKGMKLDPAAKRVDPPVETVELLWDDVKTVSNGLNRQRAVTQLKQARKTELCGDCLGEGGVNCRVCNGTGHPAGSAVGCATCQGAQTVACKTPRCKDGVIPCPAPCLKPTEGNWVKKKEDGLRWRSFPVKGKGTFSISERHFGEILDLSSGSPVTTACVVCNKTGAIKDPNCSGTGLMPCPEDLARTDAPDCEACKGTGKTECKTCEGYGLAAKGW
jgi:hypothetical protein